MGSWQQQISFLYVSNLARSHAFYAGLLGFRQVVDQGDCRIYHTVGGAYFGLCERPELVAAPGPFLFTLVTDAVEDEVARLAEQGVCIEHPVQANPTYRITQAFVLDPDGYRVEIQRFDDPNWFS